MERIEMLLGGGTAINPVGRATRAVLRTLQARGDAEVPASFGAEHKPTGEGFIEPAAGITATAVCRPRR